MLIALHAGAGFFANSAEEYCADALKRIGANKAVEKQNEAANDAIDANTDATVCAGANLLVNGVMLLEQCEALNCGLGSNLTEAGSVECEAAYMSSQQMAYGAVAAVGFPIWCHRISGERVINGCGGQVTNCMHPICAAKTLANPYSSNSSPSSSWLVQPMVLAGPGADRLCASLGIGIVTRNEQLRTRSAVKEFRRAKRMVALPTDTGGEQTMPGTTPTELGSSVRFDTVGGVAIVSNGMCEACVSSGGILLKRQGRMGHSAQFGAAVWAEQRSHSTDDCANGGLSVAVSVSGCGEALTRTHFAEALAQQILSMEVDDVSFLQRITRFLELHFVGSRRLASFPSDRLLVGGLAAIQQNQKCEDDEPSNGHGHENHRRTLLLAFHNSAHFPFAFVGPDKKIRRFKSKSTKDGQFVCNLFSI